MLSLPCNSPVFIYVFISALYVFSCPLILQILRKFNFRALFISCKQFLLNWKISLKYENKWIYVCLSIAIIPLTRNSLPNMKEILFIVQVHSEFTKLNKYAIISQNFWLFTMQVIWQPKSLKFSLLMVPISLHGRWISKSVCRPLDYTDVQTKQLLGLLPPQACPITLP